MKTLSLLLILLVVEMGIAQEFAKIIEQYAGAIYVHQVSTKDWSTEKLIYPRIGGKADFPFVLGNLQTRVVYDLPSDPFGHIIWEVPVVQNGWNGIRLQTGYVPRFAALIKPTPNSIDGHFETFAMSQAPGGTYGFRVMASDSVSESAKTRAGAGVYRDQANKLGFEGIAQLYVGETKLGLSEFFDSQVIGAAAFFDSPDLMAFAMVRMNKKWTAQDVSVSLQLKNTVIFDPLVDAVFDNTTRKLSFFEFGTVYGFQLEEHNAMLGIAFEAVEEVGKVYVVFYW